MHRMTENRINQLIDHMPIGSGIDCDYSWTKSNGKLLLHNSFHNLAIDGYYDDYSPFKVHLILANDGCWIFDKIRFNKSGTNPKTYRKYSTSSLMEYLYEIFYFHIDEYNQSYIK